MIRTLFIIAGAALVLCIVTLGGAVALGGHDLQRHGWAWTFKDDSGESVRFERVKGGGTDDLGPLTTRTLAWTGGEALTIDSSIDVEYIQGPANTVVITGPKGLTDRVTLTDGRLSMGDGDERVVFGWDNGNFSARSERDELRVVVTAPNVRRFASNGSGDLDITAYDQPAMALSISGSADVTAAGRTDALDLDIAGSGDADLRALDAKDAKIAIAGSGDADIAPTGDVQVRIAGSGDVTLATRPAKLTSEIAGSGDVYQN
ncbi:MAG: GIN domain-containing protein [Brevundimonas sp.]